MYEKFYELKEKPFNLTPSPRFLYLSEGHKEALSLLRYGVLERMGFILLTGEVGTGKTTMVRALLDSLDSSIMYVHLSNPLLSQQEFIDYLAFSTFKKESYFNSKAKFLLAFQAFLQRCLKENKNFNLIIDEAHKLSFELLEEIRLLSNMETGNEKLMNIFLVGQPELNEKLSEIRSRPLLQRISIRHHIPPLNLNETRAYMATRLKVAGSRNIDNIFSRNAITAIYQLSLGYPREINILADNALLLGYSRGIRTITPNMVKASFKDLKLDHSFVKSNVRESKFSIIKQLFSLPTRHWKAACILLFVILISLFAPSRQGKQAISNLKSLVPQDLQTEHDLLPQEPFALNEMIDQKIEDIPEVQLPEPKPSTNETNQTNKTNKTIKKDKQLSSNEPPASNEIVFQKIEDIPEIRPLEPKTITNKTNETNRTNLTNKVIKTNKHLFIIADGNDWKTITIKRGDTFSKLIAKAYGRANPDNIELVKKHNPQIKNVNKIEIGQKIHFPPLDLIPHHRDTENTE